MYYDIYINNEEINSKKLCNLLYSNDTISSDYCGIVHDSILSMGLKTAISAIEMNIRNVEYFVISYQNLTDTDFRESIKKFDFSPLLDLKAKYLNKGYDYITLNFMKDSLEFLDFQLMISKIRFIILIVVVIALLVLALGIYISRINKYMMDVRKIISILPSNVLYLRINEIVNALKKIS